MDYPWIVLRKELRVAPVLGNALAGPPHLFDFGGNDARRYMTEDFDRFQEQIEADLREAGSSWGIGRYLEDRRGLLHRFPQMIESARVIHAGLDVMAPSGTSVHAPIAGEVVEVGFDEGAGNYGAYLRLKHETGGEPFHSLYGHLDRQSRCAEGTRVEAGEVIAHLGSHEDTGGWFSHLHLQVLSQRAVNEGKTRVGYVRVDEIPTIDDYFPSPLPLFRS